MLKIKRTGTFGNNLQLPALLCLHDTFTAFIMTLYCTQPWSVQEPHGEGDFKEEFICLC